MKVFTFSFPVIQSCTEGNKSYELHQRFHKPVAKMTDMLHTPVNHKRKNGTIWIRSKKTNAFSSLRVRREIDLSAPREQNKQFQSYICARYFAQQAIQKHCLFTVFCRICSIRHGSEWLILEKFEL